MSNMRNISVWISDKFQNKVDVDSLFEENATDSVKEFIGTIDFSKYSCSQIPFILNEVKLVEAIFNKVTEYLIDIWNTEPGFSYNVSLHSAITKYEAEIKELAMFLEYLYLDKHLFYDYFKPVN